MLLLTSPGLQNLELPKLRHSECAAASSVNGHFYDGISICAARDSRMEPCVHSCAAYSAPCSFAASTHDLHCNRLRASESGSKRFMEHDCRTCGDEPGSSSCCRDADRAWRARSRSGTCGTRHLMQYVAPLSRKCAKASAWASRGVPSHCFAARTAVRAIR